MKYESNTKTERNRELVERHKNHPELAFRELAEIYGISKARVSQIILRAKHLTK